MAGSSKKVIYAALAGNTLIALTKFAAAMISGSSAMFSEGIHSLVDTGNQILLLFGIKQSHKPANDRFPFGHGKEIYFWSFVVAIMIFGVGAGVSLVKGYQQVRHPHAMENPVLNYIVLGMAMAFEGAAWYFALVEFTKAKGKWGYIEAVHKGKDPSIFVVLFEDSAAMLGLLVAFLGIFLSQLTGWHFIDGLASMMIGLILAGTAGWLAYETKGLLIGESANQWIVQGIREIVDGMASIEAINEVLTMHMGPEFILVTISVDFADRLTASEIETTIASLDSDIKNQFPTVKRIYIEAESRSKKAEK